MYRTFRGFLRAYCTELSGLSTSSLRRLCAHARSCPRLVEPLFVLAAENGKADYLVRLSRGAWFHEDYAALAIAVAGFGDVAEFLRSERAPKRYAAVLDAFLAQGDALAADRRMNALVRPRILGALAASATTRYRMCADLGLNAGNVYAYLAGDDSKVAHATALRMMRYAEGRR